MTADELARVWSSGNQLGDEGLPYSVKFSVVARLPDVGMASYPR